MNVYPEDSMKVRQFSSLKEPTAYYVVDPGKSKVSCDPKEDFEARVIIISSPNEEHWGGRTFRK